MGYGRDAPGARSGGVDVPYGMLSAFIGSVAQGTTDAAVAQRYLDGVNAFVPSSASGITIMHPSTRVIESACARGVSEFFLSRYEEFGRHQDPVLKQALELGRAVDNAELMSPQAWREHPVYRNVFHLHRLVHVMRAPLLVSTTLQGSVVFGRTDSDGPFTRAERRTVDAIARLLAIPIASLRMRTALCRERDQAIAALELCADATIMTDPTTVTRRVNGAARKLLDRLHEHDRAIDHLLVRLVPGTDGDPGVEQEAPVTLIDGTSARLRARSCPAGEDSSAIVVFLELVQEREQDVGTLAGHGLTPREQQVAELAARGLRDREIAQQLFLSPYTVKQYLKGVYSKLGVRSRVDLARMAVQAPPVLPAATHGRMP